MCRGAGADVQMCIGVEVCSGVDLQSCRGANVQRLCRGAKVKRCKGEWFIG